MTPQDEPAPDDGPPLWAGRRLLAALGSTLIVALASGCAAAPPAEEEPSPTGDSWGAPAAAAYPLPTRPNLPAPPAKPWERARSGGPATALPSPAPTILTPAPTVTGPCLSLYGPGTSVPLNVQVTGTTATVSWYHNGDPATQAYDIGVQPQIAWGPSKPAQPSAGPTPAVSGSTSASPSATRARPQPSPTWNPNGRVAPMTWQRFVPDRLCRTISVRITGLTRGVGHVLILDAESFTPEVAGGTTRHNLNQVWFQVP